MSSSIRAGLLYFAIVFAIGFLLGTIRVLVLVPRLGELVSVLIESPVILSASWIVCGRLISGLRVPDHWRARFAMGAVAFALLMVAELVLSVSLLGNSPAEHLASYRSAHGALGLAGQVLFAAFPLLRLVSETSRPQSAL